MFYINIPHQLPPELSSEARTDVYMTLAAPTLEALAKADYRDNHQKGAVQALQEAIKTYDETDYDDYNKYHHQVGRFLTR